MYQFFMVITILMSGQTPDVRVHHNSSPRFMYGSECEEAAKSAADYVLAQATKRKLKASVSYNCAITQHFRI